MISCKSNTNDFLTCPKTWGKQPKQLKILRIDHFCYVLAVLPGDCENKKN